MTANPEVGAVVDDAHRAELPVRLSDLHPDVRARLALVDEAVGLAMLGGADAVFALKDCAAILMRKAEDSR